MDRIRYKQVVFVVWKWKHLSGRDITAGHIKKEIENTPDSVIIEISDDLNEADLRKVIVNYAQNTKECLLLVHRSGNDTRHLKPALYSELGEAHKLVIRDFGGGADFIYFNPNLDTGWIGQTRCEWAHDVLNFKDDESVIYPQLFNASGHLLEAYFTPVWRHYYQRHSSKLFHLHQTILYELEERKVLNDEVFNEPLITLSPEKATELLDLLDDMQLAYRDNEPVKNAIVSLQQFTRNTSIVSNTELQQLSKKIVDLLDSTGEPVTS